MIRLNLTLGNTFFEKLYLPCNKEFVAVLPKMMQHRIVLSEKLINYYEDEADKIGLRESCETYIQDMILSSENCLLVGDYKNDKIEEELIELAFDQPMKVLLAENVEIKRARKGVNLYSCKDIKDKQNCVLNLYSLPITSRYIRAKQKPDICTKWLGNWFKNELNVTIRDKYLLKPEGICSFKKYFLPLIEKKASIAIHTDQDVDEEYINEFDKPEYKDYQINIYKCDAMHERVFIFNDFQIVIGKGVGFLSADWNMTSESFISISEVTIDASKTVLSQIR